MMLKPYKTWYEMEGQTFCNVQFEPYKYIFNIFNSYIYLLEKKKIIYIYNAIYLNFRFFPTLLLLHYNIPLLKYMFEKSTSNGDGYPLRHYLLFDPIPIAGESNWVHTPLTIWDLFQNRQKVGCQCRTWSACI